MNEMSLISLRHRILGYLIWGKCHFCFSLIQLLVFREEKKKDTRSLQPRLKRGRELLPSKLIPRQPWAEMTGFDGSRSPQETPNTSNLNVPKPETGTQEPGNLSTDVQRVDQISLSFRGRRLKQNGTEELTYFPFQKPSLSCPGWSPLVHPLIPSIRFAFKGPSKIIYGRRLKPLETVLSRDRRV